MNVKHLLCCVTVAVLHHTAPGVLAETNSDLKVNADPSLCMLQQQMSKVKHARSLEYSRSRPWTAAQSQCVESYLDSLESILPGSAHHLRSRQWGGAGNVLKQDGKAPILVAGFGTTATRSLAVLSRQLGLMAHHYTLSDAPAHFWPELRNAAVLGNISEGAFGSRKECAEHLNTVNFTAALDQGFDILLDTPMAENFLDFFAVSPTSKVILTKRNSTEWVLAREEYKNFLNIPIQSPCGYRMLDVPHKVSEALYDRHSELVRCMVPSENFLELDIFRGSAEASQMVARFLGKAPAWYPPFPHITGGPSGTHSRKYGICVTGQLRRLELESKVLNLFQPAIDAGMKLSVALVLDPREDTTYVHRGEGQAFNSSYFVTGGRFHSMHDISRSFMSGASVVFDPFVPSDDIVIDDRYLTGLVSRSRNDVEARTRLKSHVRQWQTLSRCSDVFDMLGSAANNMDYMLHIREDDFIMSKFVPSGNTPGVVVPSCMANDGVNDKLMLAVGADSARACLTSPLTFMHERFEEMQNLQEARSSTAMNPESVIMNSLILSNVTIRKVQAKDLSFITCRYVTQEDEPEYLCLDDRPDAQDCMMDVSLRSFSGDETVFLQDDNGRGRMRCRRA
eukprot:TRINITY_DN456_c0_g1_i1.p1 TRINITY_DN456_c0_g1~~TRINITY_DN456_c0_g1_i1.p1  ORF type:complete len:622 (+),score=69.31 TRINITY_DN456_c0_g1_i1:74-1939(+)